MRTLIRALLALSLVLCLGVGCSFHESPHVVNPRHWNEHIAQIFGPHDGSLHNLHVSIDRVILGVENYGEFENSEQIYSQ